MAIWRRRLVGARVAALVAACALASACGGGDSDVPSGWTGYEGDGYRAATAPGWELLRFPASEIAQRPELDAKVAGLGTAAAELMRLIAASVPPAGAASAVTVLRIETIDMVVFGERESAPPFALVATPCELANTAAPTGSAPPAGFAAADSITVDGVQATQLVRETAGGLAVLVQRAVGGCVDVVMFVAAGPERVAEFQRFLGTMRFDER